MRFLVLEDDPERIEQFRKRFEELGERKGSPVKADFTDRVEECMSLLKLHKYDVVFLDHDLGGEQMIMSARADTGAEVARRIVSEGLLEKHAAYVTHSFNPGGRRYIAEMLGAVEIPAVWGKSLFHSTFF